jgi:hypothetical protein
VENLGREAVNVTLNESNAELSAGTLVRLPLERQVPSWSPAAAYEPDFADVPEYDGEIDPRTSY